MDNIKISFMNVISNVFTSVMKAQEEYIRHSEYSNLSLTEMHVLEAVKKENFPTMSNVSARLKITIGTLTTNVKTIIKKGYLTKKPYPKDHRFMILSLTPRGEDALKVHDQFHQEIIHILDHAIPESEFSFVYHAFEQVQDEVKTFNEELKNKNKGQSQ